MVTNTRGEGETPESAAVGAIDGAVIVISLWTQGPEDGFLARLTATTPEGMRSVDVAGSPEDLLEKFRIWVTTTRAMHANG
jgi:hypothetical protein